MRLAFMLASRSWGFRRARALFSLLGVAIGVATVVAVFAVDYNTILHELRRKAPQWAGIDAEVSPAVPDPARAFEVRRGIASRPDVEAVAGYFFQTGMLRRGDRPLGAVQIFGLDPQAAERFQAYRVASGADLPAGAEGLDPPPLLLGAPLARRHRIQVGDTVELGPIVRRDRRCVGGEWVVRARRPAGPPRPRVFRVQGILAPERVARRNQGRVVVIPFAEGPATFPDTPHLPVFWLKLREGADPARFKREMAAENLVVQKPRTTLVGEARQERAFRNGVRTAALLALLLGLFIIFHTMSLSLAERIRQVGLLRAIGMTGGQLTRALLVESGGLAAAGAVAGIGLGALLARFLLHQGITTLGLGQAIELFELPWGQVLGVAGLGLGVALLGAVYPVIRARKLSALEALGGRLPFVPPRLARGFQGYVLLLLVVVVPAIYFFVSPILGAGRGEFVRTLVLGGGLVLLFVAALLLSPALTRLLLRGILAVLRRPLGIEGRLAASALVRAPQRASASVCALLLVTASMIALAAMTGSLKGEILQWGREAAAGKVFVEIEPAPREEFDRQVRRLPGCVAAMPLTAEVSNPFVIRGVDADALRAFGPLARDDRADVRERFARGEGVLVTRELARDLEIEEGATLPFPTAGGLRRFPVLAVTDAYGFFPDSRSYALVEEEALRKAFCVSNASVGRFQAVAGPGVPAAALAAAIRRRIPPAQIHRLEVGDDVLAAHLEDIDRDFVIFDVILVLTAALAGIGLLNALLLELLERRKEIGVLRVAGLTRSQLAKMLVFESLAVGAGGGLLGFLAGIPFSAVVVRGLRDLSGMDLPYVFPASAGLWAWAVAIGISAAAAAYPALRSGKVSVLEAVRYE